MQLKNHIIKKNLYIKWFVSYSLILVVPLIISSIMYLQMSYVVKNEINNANEAMLKQTKQTLDTQIYEVERLAMQIATNTRIDMAISVKDSSDPLRQIYFYNAIKDLKSYQVHNSFVKNYYIYCNNFDKVMSANTQTDKESFYYSLHNGGGMSFDEWKEIMQQPNARKYVKWKTINDNGEIVDTVAYLQSLPVVSPREPLGMLVMLIDETEFNKNLVNIEWLNQGNAYILDCNNNIITSNDENVALLPLDYNSLTDNQGLIYKKSDGKRFVVSYISSDVTDWKYVSVIPHEVFWQKVNYIRKILIIGGLFCLIIGFTIVVLVLKQNYDPIKQLLADIREKAGGYKGSEFDGEYELIGKALNKVFNEKEELVEAIDKQKSILKDSILKKLLNSDDSDETIKTNNLMQYDIDFKSDVFAVMLFKLEDYVSLFPENKPYRGQSPTSIIRFAIGNVLDEMVGENNQAYVIDIGEYLVGIISFEGNVGLCKEFAFSLAPKLKTFFEEKLKVYLTISVGNAHEGISNISYGYSEAVTAMDYRMIFGKNQVIFYSDIKNDNKNDYFYSIEIEQKLLNSIKSGNVKIAKEVIDEIFNKNFYNGSITIQMTKCLVYDIAGTMLKITEFIHDAQLIEELQMVKNIITSDTVDDLRLELISIVESTCEYINKKSASFSISDRVINYIDENYNDVNLNVNSIGEKFNMAPSYLSKLFKQQIRTTIPDYINRSRIENAKVMLENSDKNINEIAVEVGYLNSNAFIVAFKKYQGLTPGQYKKQVM